MAGRIFTITPDLRKVAEDAISDMIDQLGKECLLLYPSVEQPCPNCIYDPTTKRSTGIYKTGGPTPFQNKTICPVCRGNGRLPYESATTVTLLCQWNPRQYQNLGGNVQAPYSIVRTKGFLSDLPKVQRAKRMIIELPVTPLIRATFDLASEPVDAGNIVPGKFFTCIWKRSG